MRADDIVARFGGEEFVILLRVQAAQHAQALAEKLCERLRQQTVTATDGQTFGFTVSIGIALAQRVTGTELPLDAMLREADELLYRAKANGRDRIETATG